MSCSSLDNSSCSEHELLVYFETRKAILREYRDVVREKADQIRSSAPALSERMDIAQAMTHEFLRHAWTTYVGRAEQRFGRDAVALALREIIPL
jgi:hypothetical protein